MRHVRPALMALMLVAVAPLLLAPVVTFAQDATPEAAHAQVTVAGTALELLPEGASDTLDVIAVGPYVQNDVSTVGSLGYVPFVLRNNTPDTLTSIDVALDVRSEQGLLFAAGRATDLFAPTTLEPGDVAIGIVGLVSDEVVLPSTPVFDFTVESHPVRESAARGVGGFRILDTDVVAGQLVGQVQNETGALQTYVEPVVMCFTEDGTPSLLLSEQVEGDAVLPENGVLPGRIASFQFALDDATPCLTYLVAVDWT